MPTRLSGRGSIAMSNGTVTLIGSSSIAFLVQRQKVFPVERKYQKFHQIRVDNKLTKIPFLAVTACSEL